MVNTMAFIKKSTLLYLLSLVLAIFVFLKTAWISEDAYIMFRSIEQLFAGNGPVWNPHERVQVFTSPLWFFLLSTVRIFSHNVYLNAIVVSLILWILTIFTLKKTFESNVVLLTSILLFSASSGFYDYTSSGLENVLAYFVIAAYILNYTKLFAFDEDSKIPKENLIKFILISFGLIICVRHDLLLILLPPTIYAVFKNWRLFSIKQWIILGIMVLSPFILWSLFSLIYYGFLFPNTAYAKLNTGIPQIEIFIQGLKYFISSLKYDTGTLLVITGSLVLNLFSSSKKYLKYLGYGVLLNLIYVVYVGGDFMQGRFLSYAYMVSVILLLLRIDKILFTKFKSLTIIVGLFLVLYPHTPFNSSFYYRNGLVDMGISDERGFYFQELSLFRYSIRDKKGKFFPVHPWAQAGYEFKESSERVAIMSCIGLFGYHSGTGKIIIDVDALSDPLLARLPVTGSWRIGHFRRTFPDGYVESIKNGNEAIVNPRLNEFYKKLKILTQNEKLFTQERLKTIFLFNIGAYDHLLIGE